MGQIAIEKTPLWADIRDVMYSKAKPTRFEYRGMLHTEKEDLPVLKIESIDFIRDYVNNIGDVVHMTFRMPLGEYILRLYPYRTNLEFTIKKILLTDFNGTKIDESRIVTTRYKAVFLVEENQILTGSEYEHLDLATLNNMDIITVKLQLLDRSLEVIRIRQAHGAFKNVTQRSLIHNLVAGESLKVQVDGRAAIDGINIIDPDNSKPRPWVVIPSSTLITTIPSLLQEKMGGVYNSGIGSYLQKYYKKNLWFVYPTWNTKRFENTKDNRVIFYALPEGRYTTLDRTYQVEPSILKVLITGQRKYNDSADIDYINTGSGFRMQDARALMKKPVLVKEDGPYAQRSNLNTEVIAEHRKDGLNYAPRTSGPSSNPFKEYSYINAKNIARIDVVWENADIDLLYPGMPCKYIFLDDGKAVELKGTVGFVQSTTQLQGNGINGKVYMTNCTITLMCEQKPNTRKLPKDKPVGGTF